MRLAMPAAQVEASGLLQQLEDYSSRLRSGIVHKSRAATAELLLDNVSEAREEWQEVYARLEPR